MSRCRQYTTEYKLDTYVKVARLYLEDDDPVNAEAFINRASHLQADTKDEKLQIYYKVQFTPLISVGSNLLTCNRGLPV